MATFYENAGLCCMPSRRRSVFLWLDYNVLKVSNGIAATSTTSTGRATTAAAPTIIDTFVRAGHIDPTGLSDGKSHSCGHLRQPDGTHSSCSYAECQHFP